MVNVHSTIGTLVVVGYLAATVLHGLALAGRPVPWARMVSFVASGLLLVQYLLGFWLLGDGRRNETIHYVLALAALITVGLEHGFAPTRPTPRERALTATVATAGTLVLVLGAYVVGMT